MKTIALILAVTTAQFVLGALWYSPLLFGKWWMQIMEMTNVGKEELQKMQKEMGPFYLLQFFLTLITTWVLASNFSFMNITGSAMYYFAFFMWLGYIAPTQIGTVLWGRTKKQFWCKQIFVMLTYSFVGIMLATFILSLWM